MVIKSEIEKLIQKAADDLGYMIYDTVIYLKGVNSKITVKIDSLDGISHRDCEIFSKKLDELMAGSELIPNYLLEISSPGLDRELRSIDEIRRFAGEPMKLICTMNGENRVYQGIVLNITDDKIEINSENKSILINYSNIAHAYLDY